MIDSHLKLNHPLGSTPLKTNSLLISSQCDHVYKWEFARPFVNFKKSMLWPFPSLSSNMQGTSLPTDRRQNK